MTSSSKALECASSSSKVKAANRSTIRTHLPLVLDRGRRDVVSGRVRLDVQGFTRVRGVGRDVLVTTRRFGWLRHCVATFELVGHLLELLRRRLVALTEADLVTVRAWRQFHAVVRLRGDAGAVWTLHDVARVVPHDDLTAVRPDRRLTSDLHVRNEVAGRQGMNEQLHIRCDVHLDARL